MTKSSSFSLPKYSASRILARYRYRLLVPICVLVLASCTSCVFAQTYFTTKNQFVEGDVAAGSGLVTWYAFPGPLKNGVHFLSYLDHSYLTLKINGETYSNNDIASGIQHSLSTGGVLSHVADTVRCIWTFSTFDIVQDVYPVAYTKSGQVVIKVSVNNRGTAALTVASQYLLDIYVNGSDGQTVLTRYNYSSAWSQYPTGSGLSIPPFYVTFERSLPPGPPTFDPGFQGFGLTQNSNLGLITPSRMTIGDWNYMSAVPWSIAMQGTNYVDNAILLEWNTTTVAANSSSKTLQTSYGTGDYEQCNGNLFGLTFYDHFLKCNTDQTGYIPDTITVESLLFNLQTSSGTGFNATLMVGPGLTIVSPLPVTNGGSTQKQTTNPSSVQPNGVTDANWSVVAAPRLGCTSDATSYLSVAAAATGIPNPGLINCEMPITLQCCDIDAHPPLLLGYSRDTLKHTASLSAIDSQLSDLGMRDISWTSTAGELANAQISVNGLLVATSPATISGCPNSAQSLYVHQVDSTQAIGIAFSFNDCAGNATHDTIYFAAHPLAKDVTPPTTTTGQITNNAQTIRFAVSDSGTNDRGLKSIAWTATMGSSSNAMVTIEGAIASTPWSVTGCPKTEQTVTVEQVDSTQAATIDFSMLDCAGNTSHRVVTFSAHTLSGVAEPGIGNADIWLASPNPCRDEVTIQTVSPIGANPRVRLFDEAGAEIEPVMLGSKSSTELRLNTRDLPAGTFVISVESGALKKFVRLTHVR